MDSRPNYEIVHDLEQLAAAFERLHRQQAANPHYILYQFGDRSIMIKMDAMPSSVHFSYDDKDGIPATKGLKTTIANFIHKTYHKEIPSDADGMPMLGSYLQNARQGEFKQLLDGTQSGVMPDREPRTSVNQSIEILTSLSQPIPHLGPHGFFKKHQDTTPPTPPNTPVPGKSGRS